MSLPYMPFFVGDYLLDTSELTFCQHGAYCRLLFLSWITPGGTMPADPEWVRAKLQASPETFAEHVAPILGQFFKVKRGRYVNARLKLEWDKTQEKIAARKAAGKRGGLSKAQNAKGKASSKTTNLPEAKPYHSPEPRGETNVSLSSEAKASEPTAREIIWHAGKSMLVKAGASPKAAGAVLGALLKAKGEAEAASIVIAMQANPKADPETYLWGIVRGKQASSEDSGAPAQLELVPGPDGKPVLKPIARVAA